MCIAFVVHGSALSEKITVKLLDTKKTVTIGSHPYILLPCYFLHAYVPIQRLSNSTAKIISLKTSTVNFFW